MDKDALVKSRTLPEHEYEIPDVGTVRYRALSRAEAVYVKDTKMAQDQLERYILSRSMVDPKLSESDVRQWQEVSPAGEIEELSKAIAAASGLQIKADKESYKSVRDES